MGACLSGAGAIAMRRNFLPPVVACLLSAGLAGPTPARSASYLLDLQPYAICEDGRICYRPGFDTTYLLAMFAQADIVVNVLPAVELAFADLSRFVSGPEYAPDSLLTAVSESVVATAHTAHVGFTPDLVGSTVGMAFQDDAAKPFAIVQASLSPRLQASVLAHEIGHVLGATHNDFPDDLMSRDYDGWKFALPGYAERVNEADAKVFQSSTLLRPIVPQVATPPALVLFLTALGLFLIMQRNQTRRAA